MKRISLLLLLFILNLSFISCTEESLAEAMDEPLRNYATEGEEDLPPSEEEPPGEGE